MRVFVVISLLIAGVFAKNLQCERHFERYVADLAQRKIWAVSMFDATAKLQAGILSGNYANLGFFDQCLEISAETLDGRINGKYCLGQITTTIILQNKSVDLTWGVCIPNSCQGEDVAPIFLDYLSGFIDTSNLSLIFSSNLCQTAVDAHPPLSVAAIITLSVFAIIVLVVVATTAADYFANKPLPVVAKTFSAIANGKKVFCYSNNQEQMLCLNGLKVISLFWIILLHEYSIFSAGPIENLRDLETWKESLMSSYEKSGSLAVETFFVISGLLVSYNHLKKVEEGKRFNLVRFYSHRILRILPALAAVVWISGTLLQYFGSGPYWHYLIQYFQKPCEQRWWSSLLFVQNYVNTESMCVGHSWYLDVDMQLFLLSPVLLLPLNKHKKATITCIILIILASIAVTFVLAWNTELVAMSDETFGNKQLLNTTYYLKTHTRAPAWLIGFLCGVLIHGYKKRSFKLHKTQIYGLWCVSVATLFTCSFGGYYTLRTLDYKRFENAFYLAFNRPAFAVALCWVIFGCVFSYGGLVNSFLSLPVLQIISKLVYSVYLIHVTMMYVFVYGSKTSNHFSNVTLMHKFWGDCFFSMFLALFLILFIEYPAAGLERLIF